MYSHRHKTGGKTVLVPLTSYTWHKSKDSPQCKVNIGGETILYLQYRERPSTVIVSDAS